MKLTITITRDDIRRGVKESFDRCPIALALKRALRSNGLAFRPVSVCTDFINLGGADPEVTLPDAAAAFVVLFDDNCEVEPFSFELEVPDA